VAPGCGVLFHNRGQSFRLQADSPNVIAGGKRPFHTIIPAFMEQGDSHIGFGIMGGSNQPLAHAQFVSNLVDYDKILPKVWGILGWNIYLYHAHLIVTPPSGQPHDDKTFGWHQDSGRVNVEIECHPRPQLKAR
jgi:hypothetical protein